MRGYGCREEERTGRVSVGLGSSRFALKDVATLDVSRVRRKKRKRLDAQVSIQTPQHGLMTHDQDVLLPLQFENDRLESNNNVAVRLSTSVAVVELVVVARVVVFGIVFLRSGRDPE